MDKRIFLIVLIILLLIINANILNTQKKLYNTYTNRSNITDKGDQTVQYDDTYNIEEESIKFVYKFLENWQNNLTLDYLDENFYNSYSGNKKNVMINYMRNLEVVDKMKNEVVLVKSGTTTNAITKRKYVNITYYVSDKKYKFTSLGAFEIKGNSLDADKKFSIMVYSDIPYNFKIQLYLENNLPNDNGRSIIGT